MSKEYSAPAYWYSRFDRVGFLEQKAGVFMVELWRLLIEAQNSENGIVSEIDSSLAL